jgi:hypothetical protein
MHKKGKTVYILLEFPYSTSVCCALLYIRHRVPGDFTRLVYEQEYGIWTVSDNDRKLIKLDISLIYVVILWPNGWLVC